MTIRMVTFVLMSTIIIIINNNNNNKTHSVVTIPDLHLHIRHRHIEVIGQVRKPNNPHIAHQKGAQVASIIGQVPNAVELIQHMFFFQKRQFVIVNDVGSDLDVAVQSSHVICATHSLDGREETRRICCIHSFIHSFIHLFIYSLIY